MDMEDEIRDITPIQQDAYMKILNSLVKPKFEKYIDGFQLFYHSNNRELYNDELIVRIICFPDKSEQIWNRVVRNRLGQFSDMEKSVVRVLSKFVPKDIDIVPELWYYED